MSLVFLMMGLRVPLFPPLNHDSESRALDLGVGGGIIIIIMTGMCGPNLEDPSPIHINAKPENHTYSYIFPRENPMGFAFALTTVCVYTQGQILVPCSYASCSLNLLSPHFYIAKLGSTGLLIIPPISALTHRPGYPLEPPLWCGSSV